jgi:hypothetical protein
MSDSMLIDDEEKNDSRADLARTQALDHAWNWWKYHGDQRITMVRFYLVTLGAIAAGIGVLQQQERHVLSASLSLFGALSAFCFLRPNFPIPKTISH